MMFGLGGIFVEVLKDVSYRLAPLSAWDAQDMIREIRAYALLAGARGGRSVDEEALVDVLVSVSHLVDDFREIVELDLNPVFVDGGLMAVADARIIIA
jgi:acetyltransferase